MKVALLCLEAGVPQTLATTAFMMALADGLTHVGVEPRIIGLTRWPAHWNADTMRPFVTAAPWLSLAGPHEADAEAAARLGLFAADADARPSFHDPAPGMDVPEWYLEYVLDQELCRLAGDEHLAMVVYPISWPVLRLSSRIARRRGWTLIVQSCEAMSGAWIDPVTREQYVRGVVEGSDGVWVVSTFLRDYWFRQGVPADRVLVHPQVVRIAAFTETAASGQSSPVVYLGNLEHREIDYLFEISLMVKEAVPGYRLVVYGDAPEARRAERSAQVASLGLSGTVTLMPAVPPLSVPEVLQTAAALVLPRSRGEFSAAGFPNKLGEYLASGRPVVVTRVGDIPRHLAHEESAYLVEPDDSPAFARALIAVLSDPDGASAVGARGRRVAAELLASPVAARRILEFVSHLAPPARARSERS